MRLSIALVALALVGCAQQQPTQDPAQDRRIREYYEEMRASAQRNRDDAERALTPTQRAQRDLDAAKAARENELLERALTSAPDYTAAVRRAAVANVDGAAAIPPAPGTRRPAVSPRAREAAITAEEARLSDAVEARRRQRLAQQGQQQQTQRDQQAAAQCIALGQQVEASMYNHRSLLNLEATATANQARENCWQNYLASRPR